jgi:hypothetical protein
MKENQPKHRQLRKEQRKLARRKASRAGFPAILIVCEGRETEPIYIRGFCESRRINLAGVSLCAGTHETDAVSLVRIAQRRFAADPDFDCVYVVCDGDATSLERAAALAARPLKRRDGQRITVNLVRSNPCIEFWLLLHFEYSARPYANAGEVTRDLKRHLTDYDKADTQIFKQVEAGLERAMAHVKTLKRELTASGAQSPDSDMDQLIEQLLRMRRPDKEME